MAATDFTPPNMIVSGILRVGPVVIPEVGPDAGTARAAVHLENGETAWLEQTSTAFQARMTVLTELPRTLLSASVEIEPTTRRITDVKLPLAGRVLDIVPLPAGDFEVRLFPSCARHTLKAGNDTLLSSLQQAQKENAPVLVTETPVDHEIVALSPAPNYVTVAPPVAPTRPVVELSPALSTVSAGLARELFESAAVETCDPNLTLPPCIPFKYPDNGCWARAHQMTRLFAALGHDSGKLWIFGALTAKTANNPNCKVHWTYHVVPYLLVETAQGSAMQVVDPSLFDEPVPVGHFQAVLADPAAKIIYTSAQVFCRESDGVILTDDDYAETAQTLALYRHQLALRAAQYGDPPYRQCLMAAEGAGG